MTDASTDACEMSEVPIIERVAGGGLTSHLRSEPVQRLMSDRVDVIEVKRVSSYIGQASVRSGLRIIRMSVHPPLKTDATTFILCHELAHHEAGVGRGHCDRWREACAGLLREAGALNLLPPERVTQGVEMVLDGTATRFRGWPEQARKRLAQRDERREARLEHLRERGLVVGCEVVFRYHGTLTRAEVMRVNTATVSVGPPGSGQTALRVPFGRVLQVLGD